MTTLELLSNLRSKDIEIWADGDQLGYKAPKGALTPDLRKELAARKSEILALLRQTDTVTSTASFPLKPVSRAGDLPLSFAQERLWFLHHLEPDSAAYSLPRSIRLKGVLRKDALEKTYVELARRHETLRTTFHSTDGNPVLRIAAEPDIVFDTIGYAVIPLGIAAGIGSLFGLFGGGGDKTPDLALTTRPNTSLMPGMSNFAAQDIAFNLLSGFGSIGGYTQHDAFKDEASAQEFVAEILHRGVGRFEARVAPYENRARRGHPPSRIFLMTASTVACALDW